MTNNILIVDDEPDIREMVAAFLEDESYETYCVANAQDAQAYLNTDTPSLAILDIWMRDSSMDGISLLNWIKDSYPDIPVIMISGHGTVEMAVNAIKAGAYDFIEKPFKAEKLVFMVKRALEISGLKKENAQLKQKIRSNDPMIEIKLYDSLTKRTPKIIETNISKYLKGATSLGLPI